MAVDILLKEQWQGTSPKIQIRFRMKRAVVVPFLQNRLSVFSYYNEGASPCFKYFQVSVFVEVCFTCPTCREGVEQVVPKLGRKNT